VVHSTGGWAALAGAIVLGARIGKYGPKGEVNAMPGHNMSSVFAGGLVLWFGWFGFNPGSTMGVDAASIGHIAVTTNMAAAVATLTSAITAWLLLGKPDFSMIVNGTLAGLVAITAGCAFVSVGSSMIIGGIAGVIVVFAVLFFDKVKIDDPVGALSVHLANGIFGTLCVGLFAKSGLCGAAVAKDGLFMGGGTEQLIPQIKGIVIAGVITFVLSMITWVVLKVTLGLRVSQEEELEGLDIGEHGSRAYPDFEIMPGGSPMAPSHGGVPVGAGKPVSA
jgi:ammonium transporter, Amt family